MPPLHLSTASSTEITTKGRAVQEKNGGKTIKNVLEEGVDGVGDWEAATGGSGVRGAYLHVPFCFHKCHYCDFYSIVDSRDRQEAFTDRLIDEIQAVSEGVREPVETVFVGGGTPTLLASSLWIRLLRAIDRWLPRQNEAEFTVEANPETLTPELASILAVGGVNRISIGCQSFNPTHLKTLERWHDPQNVHRSVEIVRAAGIDNYNLDLIFAVPGQTLDQWLDDLREVLSLKPSHISCYGLMYEPNTPLTVKMRAGQVQQVDPDLEAAMYSATIDILAKAGYEHYEISNWAREKPSPPTPLPEGEGRFRCRHNMLYWTNANWWPFGPSASGHLNGLRWKNVARLGEYLEMGPLPPICDVERLDEDGRIGEQFMLGLRLIEGIALAQVDELLSRGRRGAQRKLAIERHVDAGLVLRTQKRLRFSATGLMLADAVLSELI